MKFTNTQCWLRIPLELCAPLSTATWWPRSLISRPVRHWFCNRHGARVACACVFGLRMACARMFVLPLQSNGAPRADACHDGTDPPCRLKRPNSCHMHTYAIHVLVLYSKQLKCPQVSVFGLPCSPSYLCITADNILQVRLRSSILVSEGLLR